MKPNRNDPCPCGSGKKYKHCCERNTAAPTVTAAPSLQELNQLIESFNSGKLLEVEQQARRLIAQFPTSGIAYKLLGVCLNSQGKQTEALPPLLKATTLLPKDAEAYYNLGVTQEGLEQYTEAVTSYRASIALNPNLAATHNNLGNALRKIGEFDASVRSCRRALEIKSNYAGAHFNLGCALKELGKLDEAMASFRSVVDIVQLTIKTNSSNAETYKLLGDALKDLEKFDEAIANYQRALKINPKFAEAHFNMGYVKVKLNEIDDALASFRRTLSINPEHLNACASLLFTLSYNGGHAPSDYLQIALRYGKSVAKRVSARYSAWLTEANPHKLRIGIVSGDLRQHSVGYFLENLVTHLNSSTIELIAYSTVDHVDELTRRMQPHFTYWQVIFGMTDQAAAQLIHDDGIHVLLDLSGHTENNRLPVFAWKPAPVQCTWLGFPSTTGVVEMDYVLGDLIATPLEDAGHFTEKIWQLPESYICLSTPDAQLTVSALPAQTNGFVTFGSFNNLSKVNDATIAVWAKILTALPAARLFLKAKQLTRDSIANTTLQRFAVHGIGADRLTLEDQTVHRDNHLATYQRMDIALDPFPYPGVTTTCEALWMGVPVLSMQGDRFLSRTAATIAYHAGLPDWIASSEDDYVAKAIHFASDLPKLASLRAGLREQVRTSPLFDAPRFAKHLEAALWGMWQAKQPALIAEGKLNGTTVTHQESTP